MTSPLREMRDGPELGPPDCNLCGRTCLLHEIAAGPEAGPQPERPVRWVGGLERAVVTGGYESTPGNGPPGAALDDCSRYSFSLCEHCLDFLFRAFAVPPVVRDCAVDGTPLEAIAFVPAAERVERDEWRKQKNTYRSEAATRAKARAAGVARALGQDFVLRFARRPGG